MQKLLQEKRERRLRSELEASSSKKDTEKEAFITPFCIVVSGYRCRRTNTIPHFSGRSTILDKSAARISYKSFLKSVFLSVHKWCHRYLNSRNVDFSFTSYSPPLVEWTTMSEHKVIRPMSLVKQQWLIYDLPNSRWPWHVFIQAACSLFVHKIMSPKDYVDWERWSHNVTICRQVEWLSRSQNPWQSVRSFPQG